MAATARLTVFAVLTAAISAQVDPFDSPHASDRLLVCNRSEHTVSIITVARRAEIAVIKTGVGPRAIAVSPNGRTAVTTNYGDDHPGHTLTVIDVVSAKLRGTVNLHRTSGPTTSDSKKHARPHGVQFVSDHRVIVTSEASRSLLLVNLQTGIIERAWSTPQTTMRVVSVTKDGKHAATSSVADGTLAFFDLANINSPAPSLIKIGKGSEGLAIHPVTGNAWVANRSNNTISVVSRTTGKIETTLDTGSVPFRIAFTANHKWALVTCTESGELMIFDVATRKLLREGSIHGDRSEQSSLPLGVVSGPDSRLAYVTCARGEFIAIVDLQTGQLIDRIDARKSPNGIAYARPR